jgi:hypothetical protein
MHTVPSMVPPHVPVAAQDPERVSFKDLADSLLGAMTATQEALAHTAGDAGTVIPVAPVASEPIVMPPALDLGLEPGKVVEPVAEPQPVVTPAGIEQVVEPATTPAMPQGFEGLKFPNDGVLTRQWMEFLSQMSTTK